MRPPQMRILTLLLPALVGGVSAEVILIETQAGGKNHEQYTEVSGAWADEAASSGAPGLTPEGGSRVLLPEAGKLTGVAAFRTAPTEDGDYFVDVTWPASANASSVTVRVQSGSLDDSYLVEFVPGGAADSPAGKWVRVATVPAKAGENLTLMVVGGTATGASDSTKSFALAVGAVRFSNEPVEALEIGHAKINTLGAAIAREAQAAPLAQQAEVGEISPFGAPAVSLDNENPFDVEAAPKNPVSAPEANPFTGAERAISSDSPFGAPPAVTSANPDADPFAQAEAAQADPFAAAGAKPDENPFPPPPPDSPFAAQAIPAAADVDPFAAPEIDQPVDPFASVKADAAANTDPFVSTAPVADSPFGAPPVPVAENPFSSAPPPVDGPFSATTPPPATEDPFASPAPVVAEPAPVERASVPLDIALAGTGQQETLTDFVTSIDSAKAAAKASGKPILVLFSGESEKSRRFERVLASTGLSPQLSRFEVVKIDYRGNRALAREFAVHEFPYVVVLNRFGYTAGHMLPIWDEARLAQELEPFTQSLF